MPTAVVSLQAYLWEVNIRKFKCRSARETSAPASSDGGGCHSARGGRRLIRKCRPVTQRHLVRRQDHRRRPASRRHSRAGSLEWLGRRTTPTSRSSPCAVCCGSALGGAQEEESHRDDRRLVCTQLVQRSFAHLYKDVMQHGNARRCNPRGGQPQGDPTVGKDTLY